MFGFGQSKNDPSVEFKSQALSFMNTLYSTAMRLTKNSKDAQDLVQETYLRAFRFESQFEPGTQLKSWLFRILMNTFINHYRKKVRVRALNEKLDPQISQDAFISSDSIEAFNNPENDYLSRMVSQEVIQALEDLPEDYRIVVLMCDIHELTYKEIAETLNIPVGTVMSRLFRGRQKLKQILYHYAVSQGIITPEEEEHTISEVSNLSEYRQKRVKNS